MTRRFKIISVAVAIITLFISTYGGVLAANKLDGLSIGALRNYASLDAIDGNVGMVNILLIGVDEGGYRSDTIMLASIDGSVSYTHLSSLRPRFRIVSIIPGIDALAPERTDTSSGFSRSPNFLPVISSIFVMVSRISA